jgi:hypothetical protein
VAVTAQGARSLAYWLSVNAPQLYLGLAHLAAQQSKLGDCASCRSHGLGQDTTPVLDYFTPSLTASDYIDPSTFTIPEITVTGSATPDLAFTTVDPSTFAPITVDQSALTVPDIPAYTPAPLQPGMLSTVGNFLTTGGGISALLGLGTQVLKTQAAGSNAVAAQAILTAQTSRVLGGGTPAAISYTRDPRTGQVIPVLGTSVGQVPVTHSMLTSLAPNAGSLQITTFLSQYGLYLAAGLVALLLIARR